MVEGAAAQPDMTPLVVDGYAAFPQGKGGIRFPKGFKGGLYKAFHEAMQQQEGDTADAYFKLEPHWRAVCVVAMEIDIVLDGEAVSSTTAFDDVDFTILTFAKDALNEWIAPFLIGDNWRVALSDMLAAKVRARGR